MLDLEDFFHLPQVDALVEHLVADEAGLVIVAGLDPPAAAGDFLPSGRATLFRILMRQILAARQLAKAVVVAESREAVRVPRQLKNQVEWALIKPPYTYARRIAYAARRRPGLLVIDQLCDESAAAALEAARQGCLVLSQLDTIFCGADVARHLLELGAPRESMSGLSWIVTVQRMARLCPHCNQPEQPDKARQSWLRRRYPAIPLDGTFFRAAGCPACKGTGREGDVAAFDIFRAGSDPAASPDEQASLLSLEEYTLRLAMLGTVPIEEAIEFKTDQLLRTYRLLTASERALAESNATLQRKLTQLEAAHQVLQQRTEALISLQDVSHTLASLTDLDELASRVCRHARELCGADRAIVYFFQADGAAEVLAVNGWGPEWVHQRLDALHVMGAGGWVSANAEPVPFSGAPPGMPVHQMRIGLAGLKAGLRVPLIAQHEVVGLMIVHAAYKAGFAPGEVALLQAFANQAAVALQRAGLIDALRDKIAQLEAAQAELVEKEFIKDTFGKAVDPRVRDHLLSGHIKLGGELREATILFVDIRGFTPLSEKMKPDQVVALLNRYFEKMTRCIIEEEGLVNRYIGDAILAIFGAPVHMDNHADAAVRAALTMRAARDALNEDMQQEGLPPIYTGIGIHTGPVLAGNIGSSSRMEYTVIGDTVNLASRIEKLCKALGRDFIMSEATAMQLSAAFAPAYLDTVKIQGKQQLIKVFYL